VLTELKVVHHRHRFDHFLPVVVADIVAQLVFVFRPKPHASRVWTVVVAG
jgi:hypothetical protein